MDGALQTVFKKAKVPLVEFTTNGSVVEPLTEFFQKKGSYH
jgi:hypothetical protein